jgi:hypothetical protein
MWEEYLHLLFVRKRSVVLFVLVGSFWQGEVKHCVGDTNITSNSIVLMVLQVTQAMSKDFVKVHAMATVKESLGEMLAGGQRCALVVGENDLLEGIITSSDLQREVLRAVEESVFSDAPAIVEVHFFCENLSVTTFSLTWIWMPG